MSDKLPDAVARLAQSDCEPVDVPLSMPWVEFGERNWPEPEWIVPGFIARGQHTLLHGWRGVGKTWMVLSVAAHALTETQVLPIPVASNGWRVLLLDGEMPPRLIRDRLRSLLQGAGIEPSAVEGLHILSAMALPQGAAMHSLATPKGREDLLREIDRIGGVDTVVIDSVSTLARHPEHDENSEASWTPVQDLLLDLGRQEIGTMTVHHHGKNPALGQRGSSARETIMSLSIALTKPKQRMGPLARFGLDYTKTRVPIDLPRGFELALESPQEGDGLAWTIGREKQKTKSEHAAELIQMDPGASDRAIAERARCSHTLVGKVRKELAQHGVRWGYGR